MNDGVKEKKVAASSRIFSYGTIAKYLNDLPKITRFYLKPKVSSLTVKSSDRIRSNLIPAVNSGSTNQPLN